MRSKHKKANHKLSTNIISSETNKSNYKNYNRNHKIHRHVTRNVNGFIINECCSISTVVANVCNCEKTHRGYKNNLKISYQISDYLRHFCFYFQKNLNSLRLLIFILALITTTAHAIKTQGAPQQESIKPMPPLNRLHNALMPPSPPSSSASFKNITSNTFKNLNDLLQSLCFQSQSQNFTTLVCCNQRHLRHHQHLNSKLKNHNRFFHMHHHSQYNNYHHSRHLEYNKNFSTNILGDLRPTTNNSSFDDTTKVNKQQNILVNNNNIINIDDGNNKNVKTGVGDEHREQSKEDVRKINSLNINKFLNYIQIYNNNYKQTNKDTQKQTKNNNSNNKNSIKSINDTLVTNGLNVKNVENVENYKPKDEDEDEEEKTTSIITNVVVDHHDIDDDDFNYKDDQKDDVEEKNNHFMLIPLAPITTSSSIATTTINSTISQSVINTDPQVQLQQGKEPTYYIDHDKLMKLVMDGLGLKKPPDMKNVNISQKEYATKYQEYLQRVYAKKRRRIKEVLGDYDESFLRPLKLFSIVSNTSLLGHQQHSSSNEISQLRQKRYASGSNENVQSEEEEEETSNRKGNYRSINGERQQTLEERVKNLLFLKKKYQKPRSTKKQKDERKMNVRLMFALKPDILNLSSSDIEEANTRLVLIHSPFLAIRNSKNKKPNVKNPKKSCNSNTNEGQKGQYQINVLHLKLYFLPKIGKRILLDGQKLNIPSDLTKPDEAHTQWLQFDVTKAIKTVLGDKREQHVAFELQCGNCKRIGARILNDAYNTVTDAQTANPFAEDHQLMPVLNIIGRFDQSQHSIRPHKYVSQSNDNKTNEETTTQRHYHHQIYNKNQHNRRTNCYKSNQRCCRHSMEVTFKEIKGFEFIIQPKVFDAGYCHGRCPPRYNPAHHHAMLQSLIWKQNHHKAPRPCCAPSKLVELEVLHVDEKDSEKLKISTWSDMKVVECACS